MLTTALDKQEAGALLRKRREALGLTQDQVAERAGIPTITQLSEYENGKVNIARSKYLAKLVPVLRLTQEDIKAINPTAVIEVAAPSTYGNGAPFPPVVAPLVRPGLRHQDEVLPVHDLHRIPVRGMAAAGPAFYSDDNIIGYEYVTDDNYRPGMLSVQIDGDSMEPTIPHGSRVYIDSRELEPRDGKMYLIHITGDGLVVKRAKQISGNWFLMSDNPKYQAFTPDDATIIGEVYFVQPRGWRA